MKYLSIFLIAVFTAACSSIEPKPIAYGKSECAYCNMLVTDKKFGAEIVTDKGRYYFFDSAECMFRYMGDEENAPYKHICVTHFGQPEAVADARHSHYVISKEIPSPMGAFLSAYPSEVEARKVASESNGEAYTFLQMAEKFNVDVTRVVSEK